MDNLPGGDMPGETIKMINTLVGIAWWLLVAVLIGAGITAAAAFAWERSRGISDSDNAAWLMRIALIAAASSAITLLVLEILTP